MKSQLAQPAAQRLPRDPQPAGGLLLIPARRFQGAGYFLTDARTHRGTSGSPVVMRSPSTDAQLPWKLLGVHSARMDMGSRDLQQDETLGLNCAWYADILLTLTA